VIKIKLIKTKIRIPIGKPSRPISTKKGKKGYNRKNLKEERM